MSERFNSGAGGYTCDSCHILLWAGSRGMRYPERREWRYSETADTVLVKDNTAYCSKCKEGEDESLHTV